MVSWAETRTRLQRDRARLLSLLDGQPGRRPLLLILNPSYLCVALQRISHYCFSHGHRLTARCLWHLNLLLTGADISPNSDIGGGFVVDYPLGIGIVGRVGRNCTIHANAGIGGGSASQEDIGGGPGVPVVGDDVELESGALVMGPIRIGDRVRIGPRCLISRSVPDDTVVEPAPPRRVAKE